MKTNSCPIFSASKSNQTYLELFQDVGDPDRDLLPEEHVRVLHSASAGAVVQKVRQRDGGWGEAGVGIHLCQSLNAEVSQLSQPTRCLDLGGHSREWSMKTRMSAEGSPEDLAAEG